MNLTTNRSQGSQETNHGVQLAIEVNCMWKQLEKNKTKEKYNFCMQTQTSTLIQALGKNNDNTEKSNPFFKKAFSIRES